MYSSSYYKNLANQYTIVKNKLQNIVTYFESTEEFLNNTAQKLEEIVINNKGIDAGVIDEEVAKMKQIHNGIIALINECDQKINENNLLYQKALFIESKRKEKELEEKV